jgi:GWxTD domain-containing protein
MKHSFLILIYLILATLPILSQNNDKTSINNNDFYYDCIIFRSDSVDKSRLDVYIAVPYKIITFLKSDNGTYLSKYQIDFSCFDENGNVVAEKHFDKISKANTFFASLGGNGDFDNSYFSVLLPEGKYKINIKVSDLLSKNSYQRYREITVVNYRKYPFALSGIMIASSIYELSDKYSVTPFLSDNISNLDEGFFAFFETYNQKSADSIDFVYQLLRDNKVIDESKKITKYIDSGTTQKYLKISKINNLTTGTYILKIIALKHSNDTTFDESQYLAVTQRTITYTPSLAGNVIDNLNDAIQELRYVATQSQISHINEAQTQEDKLNRFKQFWAELDPTPNTQRNEAFEEYYSRVEFANQKFKSYTEGWKTDMGMVYIIFGPPSSIDRRQDYYNPARLYEQWTYPNGREFVFVDNNGFGDYRLLSPSGVTEKYEYNRNK